MFAADGQHLIFLAFFAGGMVCGLVYELLYFVRVVLGGGKIVGFAADLVFAVCAGAVLVFVAAKASYGQIRLYSVLSYIFGYFLEYGALHKRFAKLSGKVYNQFTAAMKKLGRGAAEKND